MKGRRKISRERKLGFLFGGKTKGFKEYGECSEVEKRERNRPIGGGLERGEGGERKLRES